MVEDVDLIDLTSMGFEHLAATYEWLTQSVEFREKIDCLTAPTKESNVLYWIRRWTDKRTLNFAIMHNQYGHIGNCGLFDLDWVRRKAQLWIYLGKYRNIGIGRVAIQKLLQKAFNEQNLIRIYLRVLVDNKRAIDFYRAYGFREEGRMRCDTIRNGQGIDALLFSMLAAEYKSSSSISFKDVMI